MINKKKLKYKNPYGDGKSGEKIVKLLSKINLKNKKNYIKNFVSKK
jgi:UDP-N-acetylglucosamine 2-epimerase